MTPSKFIMAIGMIGLTLLPPLAMAQLPPPPPRPPVGPPPGGAAVAGAGGGVVAREVVGREVVRGAAGREVVGREAVRRAAGREVVRREARRDAATAVVAGTAAGAYYNDKQQAARACSAYRVERGADGKEIYYCR